MAAAVGAAVADSGPFVAVTGQEWEGLEPTLAAAALHVLSPGPTTRLSVGLGVMLAGHHAVVTVERAERPPVGDCPLTVTTDPACAAAALDQGWTVVQPATPADVARLLEIPSGPRLLLVRDGGNAAELQPPRTASRRQWADGELATLAASGASVDAAAQLVGRLRDRGVDVSLVEIAVLDDPRHRPLVGGTGLLVGPGSAADVLRRGGWPAEPLHFVASDGVEDADLVGAVLAHVPVAS